MGLVDAVIDSKVTAGLSLVTKGKAAGSPVCGAEVVDKVNNALGKVAFGKQMKDAVMETLDFSKEMLTTNGTKDE